MLKGKIATLQISQQYFFENSLITIMDILVTLSPIGEATTWITFQDSDDNQLQQTLETFMDTNTMAAEYPTRDGE